MPIVDRSAARSRVFSHARAGGLDRLDEPSSNPPPPDDDYT
jgi:hypothetical protein